jgi:hypothetical protein
VSDKKDVEAQSHQMLPDVVEELKEEGRQDSTTNTAVIVEGARDEPVAVLSKELVQLPKSEEKEKTVDDVLEEDLQKAMEMDTKVTPPNVPDLVAQETTTKDIAPASTKVTPPNVPDLVAQETTTKDIAPASLPKPKPSIFSFFNKTSKPAEVAVKGLESGLKGT